MNREVSLIAVARVIKPFGLRGEVKLHLLADLDDFLSYPHFLIKEKFFLKKLIPLNIRGKGRIVLFQGYVSRSEAERLKGKTLYVREEDLIEKNHKDEFYSFDLEDLLVIDQVNSKIGVIREVINLNGRWYLEVIGEKEILIPFIKPFVKGVEWENRIVRVDLPEGYLDL